MKQPKNTKPNTCNLPAGLQQHADEVEVLDAATQRQLLTEVRLGRQAAATLCANAVSEQTATRLQAQVRIGHRAMNRLVCANMRLVIWVARRHQRHQRWLDLDDLVQEGVGGLTRAIEKYDPSFGTHLSTYATWWIRQSIGRAVMNAGLVRIPIHAEDGTRSAAHVQASTRRFDDIESIDHLLIELDLRESDMLADMASDEWPDPELDFAIGGAAAADEDAVDARAVVGDLLGRLTEREAFILRSRSGIGSDPMTLEEIGSVLRLTRERVRQIEAEALAKSRSFLTAA